MRHPLYLANTLVALGCALLSGTWYLPVIVVLLSFIYHERIAAREEAFLQNAFGDSFRAWASEVPAMIPAFGRYRPSDVPFQMRRRSSCRNRTGSAPSARRFWCSTPSKTRCDSGTFHVDPRWLAIFVATLVPFLIVVDREESRRGRAAHNIMATTDVLKMTCGSAPSGCSRRAR